MQVWENFTITTDANCGCCGGNVLEGCFLSLPPPVGDPAYANVTEANNVINTQTDNCKGYVNLNPNGTLTAFSVDSSFGLISFFASGNPDGAGNATFELWAAATFGVSSTATVSFGANVNVVAANSTIYNSTGANISYISDNNASHVHNISSEGNYSVRTIVEAASATADLNVEVTYDFTIPPTDNICPIRANYDTGSGYDWLLC